MKNVSFDEIESKYSELTEINNLKKSSVYLVQNQLDGRIYIKKELKNYNIDVYKQIINIRNIHMAKIYEIFKCDDSLIVIEEFINGQTLQSILDKKGKLKERVAINYIINLCSVLQVLHNQKPAVIHRDIKPSNIIIDNNGILKLIDFDVSRLYREERNMDTHILGTKGYASPEQFGFEQTDCRSDIYSVGVLLNVLTTGKHIKEKLNEGPLKSIIEKCTNISPDNRYASVKELKIALNKILNNNENNKNIKEFKVNEKITLNLKKDHNENQKNDFNNILEKVKEKTNCLNNAYIQDNVSSLDSIEAKKSEGEKNKLISIIREIPGYRSNNAKKIVIATLWYAFLVFGFTSNLGTGNIKLIFEDIALVIFFLAITLFNSNFKNIKDKLPITRNSKRENKIAGIIVYNIGMFAIYGICLDIFKLL